MEITVAREILKRAKADDIYDGDIPEDDATALTEAQNIVEQAEAAWAQHIRGPEVESILRLAAGNQNGDEPEAESEEQPSDEHAPPEVEDEDDSPTLTVSNSDELAKMDPWEGYPDETVKNVTEGLNYFAEENQDEIVGILQHVYAFEKAHKNRARILQHVTEMFERAGGRVEAQEAATGSEAEDDEPAGESETGENGSESAGEDGSEAEAEEEHEPVDEQQEEPAATEGEGEAADAEPDTKSEIGTEGSEGGTDEAEPSGEDSEGGSGRGGSAYQKLIQGVETELKRERLDIPTPPEEKAPELPWNWSDISGSDLQELHMRYAVCAYYKAYRLAFHERVAQHAKEAADALHNAKMVSISKYDEKGKEKKVALIEAEISSDEHVKRWRVIQRKHEQLAAADKRELEAYQKIVDALSRLETMRHNAWERSRR